MALNRKVGSIRYSRSSAWNPNTGTVPVFIESCSKPNKEQNISLNKGNLISGKQVLAAFVEAITLAHDKIEWFYRRENPKPFGICADILKSFFKIYLLNPPLYARQGNSSSIKLSWYVVTNVTVSEQNSFGIEGNIARNITLGRNNFKLKPSFKGDIYVYDVV